MKQLSLIEWLDTNQKNERITWYEEEVYRPYPIGLTTKFFGENGNTGYLIQQNFTDCWYVFKYDTSKTFSITSCTHLITFSSVEKAKAYCENICVEGEK